MNAEETMQEIAECSYHGTLDGVCNLGELWYEGEPSDANSHWVLESHCVEPETARRYITGWLQEWYAKEYIGMASGIALDVQDVYMTDSFLPALWLAYKLAGIQSCRED